MISIDDHGGSYVFSRDGTELKLVTYQSDDQIHVIAIDATRGRDHVHQVPIPPELAALLRDNEFAGKFIIDLVPESDSMSLLTLVEPVLRRSADTLIYYGVVYCHQKTEEAGVYKHRFFKRKGKEDEPVRIGSRIEMALRHFVENEEYYRHSEPHYGNPEIASMWRSIP